MKTFITVIITVAATVYAMSYAGFSKANTTKNQDEAIYRARLIQLVNQMNERQDKINKSLGVKK